MSELFDYRDLYAALADGPLAPWLELLPGQVEAALDPARHGDLVAWRAALESLPPLTPGSCDFTASAVRIGAAADAGAEARETLEAGLRALHPWRKGPFTLFGIEIDTEWRSDWKWDRLAAQIAPLSGRRVLDVGCGNGYHCWRMYGAGAAQVIGVDPTLRFVMQYWALRRYTGQVPVHVLPLTGEAMPENLAGFDTVFSMGVLYHRRDPQEHLQRLLGMLRPGGELVLEGLVIEGEAGEVLVPEGRYAKMRNVWALPAPATLAQWLREAGFRHVRCIDVTPTTVQEQRRTDWMRFESLANFLDPNDPSRTIEGHPAPVRAILLAERP